MSLGAGSLAKTPPESVGVRPNHVCSFSQARRQVAQFQLGRRMPMVFTHQTGYLSNSRRTKCWQLDGCRPQSSEKTKRPGLPAKPRLAKHFVKTLGILLMHERLSKDFFGTTATGLA